MYKYRVGEVKTIRAKIVPTSDTQSVNTTSAKLRLFGPSGTQIWEKTAVAVGPDLRYLLSDISVVGTYKVQWVYVIAGETHLSDKMTLTVER